MGLLEAQVTALDGTDVHILHAVVVAGLALGLGDAQVTGGNGNRLILARLGVKIGELTGRNLKFARILRNEGVVHHDLAAHVTGSIVDMDVVLGIIHVKLFGELDFGRLDILDVTRADDGVTVGGSAIGLETRFGLEVGPHVELTHGTRKRGGLGLGQRQDVDGRLVAGHLEVLLDRLGNRAEDALERVELHHAHVIVTRRDGQVATLLRIEDTLLEDSHHILLAIKRLDLVKAGLHRYFLDEEAVKRGLDGGNELRHLILGVQLDGADHRLLLIHTRLAHLDADEQVLTAHRLVGTLRHRVAVGRGGSGRALRLLAGLTAAGRHDVDGQCLGRIALAAGHNAGSTDVTLAGRRRLINHGVFLAGTAARLAVDPRRTVTVGNAGAIDEFGTAHLGRGKIAALAVVEHKGDIELVTLNDLAWRLDGKRCRLSHDHGHEQDCYIDDSLHCFLRP